MERVGTLLAELGDGRPPPADGAVEVVPQPPGPVAGVLAFFGHHVVAADVEPAWVHARLAPDDLGAPVGATFLGELGARLGRPVGTLDLVLRGVGEGGSPALELCPGEPDDDHPRVARARRYRRDLRVWETPDRAGLLLLGRGLGGRLEAAFEVAPGSRGRGLGRGLVAAARQLAPADEALFLQVAPGNVASLRAVLADGGFTPVGAEVLFPEAA